jgi:hypothetical protein
MPQVNIFRWRPGNGWLVLCGGGPLGSDDMLSVEAKMLSHTVSQGPVAYIWAASDVEAADRHMESLRDLGARTGYLVDILTEEDDLLFRHLNEAGVIILGDGPQTETLRQALVGAALRGMEDAFSRGATIYTVGQSSALFGSYAVDNDALISGFNWLAHSIIMPTYTPPETDGLRGWVRQVPNGYGLGLGQGAALALGPTGEVEVWGSAAITVSLGRGFDSGSGMLKGD